MTWMRAESILLWREKCRLFEIPAPRHRQVFESRLGKAQYYADFTQNLSSLAEPLNELRRNGKEYVWNVRTQAAFDENKSSYANDTFNIHLNQAQPFIITTEA